VLVQWENYLCIAIVTCAERKLDSQRNVSAEEGTVSVACHNYKHIETYVS